mmetsp:Transcript_8958/g.36564  ORF Transcript_8958/g.36564 Transcript_8958/m.36564 type:complete len:233 (-) Transcript_8958:1731-2429(-)
MSDNVPHAARTNACDCAPPPHAVAAPPLLCASSPGPVRSRSACTYSERSLMSVRHCASAVGAMPAKLDSAARWTAGRSPAMPCGPSAAPAARGNLTSLSSMLSTGVTSAATPVAPLALHLAHSSPSAPARPVREPTCGTCSLVLFVAAMHAKSTMDESASIPSSQIPVDTASSGCPPRTVTTLADAALATSREPSRKAVRTKSTKNAQVTTAGACAARESPAMRFEPTLPPA